MADPESPSASVQKTLKSASGGSGSPGSQPKWMKRQRRLFTNFCNAKLCDRDDVPPITDVFEDLRDGRVLYALLEELSGQSLAPLGRIKKPKKGKQETRIDHVSNLSICFRYIKQTTKTVGIGPSDIADGKPTMVLGLLWSIIVFFTSKDLGGVDDISALKKKILKWCQKRTEANTDVEIRNLKDSFMDGRAFLAIVSDVDPDGFPYAPAPDACANFSSAFAEARAKYGVPELLDGDDAECWKEDQAMVTYLSEMMKRLPEKVADATAATLAELASASAPAPADACDACAEALRSAMQKAGMAVDVIPDPAGAGRAVVRGVAPGAKEKPTVLLVASCGVDGPGLGRRRGHRDGAVVAPGAKACKAGALAPIAAVEALLHGLSDDQRPKVNVGGAAAAQFPGRPLVVLGAAPAYLPLAAAVGAALPKAATYACGLHDPGAALGEATERADLADFKGSVKTLVLLLLGAAGLPKQSKAVDPAVFFGN
ncbi:hypothetical protein JL721_7591 [Aureococcus anophagefferens]|nr:hypothetical protein JL721_7591 [Aureococcus anophagefferens]